MAPSPAAASSNMMMNSSRSSSSSCPKCHKRTTMNGGHHSNQDNSNPNQEFKTLFNGPQDERAACGVGFIVSISGTPSTSLLRAAEVMSARMEHRGACSCDNLTGDGAGVMTSIPHVLYADRVACEHGVTLPAPGKYATGLVFLDESSLRDSQLLFERLAHLTSLHVLVWSSPPIDGSCLGSVARGSQPIIRQVFIVDHQDGEGNQNVEETENSDISGIPDSTSISKLTFEQKIFFLRKWSTHEILRHGHRFYICSLSPSTIVYKGQFTPPQLWSFYLDLVDPRFSCYLALVHARFSTNTFPSWDRAQPLRMLAHNGEINTLRGNVNLMRAREGVMTSPIFGSDLSKLYPVVEPDSSDSGSVDNVLEFLFRAGSDSRTLPECVITMVPEAFTPVTREGGISRRPSAVFTANPGAAAAGDGTLHPTTAESLAPPVPNVPSTLTSPVSESAPKEGRKESSSNQKVLDPDFKQELKSEEEKRSFFQWASTSMEAWDGPALLTFSDGSIVGAILDRNGLRPSRYIQTRSGLVAMASEVGVTDFLDHDVIHKGRLKPGRMLLVDTRAKILARDVNIKNEIFRSRPFKSWLKSSLLFLPDLIGSNRRSFDDLDDESWSEDGKSAELVQLESVLFGAQKIPASTNSDPRLTLFGYSQETIDCLLRPMVAPETKKEALGSMGNDAALACISTSQPLLYDYFKQVFAQVTNPPIDPFREKIVMSLSCPVGPEANLLVPSRSQAARLWLHQPILSNREMALLKQLEFKRAKRSQANNNNNDQASGEEVATGLLGLNLGAHNESANSQRKISAAKWRSKTLSCLFEIPPNGDAESLGASLKTALAAICAEAEECAKTGTIQILILSDRMTRGAKKEPTSGEEILNMAPIPALLSLGAVHQHLIATRQRMKVALFVETGEAREIHHLCCLLGYGADAINPYLVFEQMARVLISERESGEDSKTEADLALIDEETVFETYSIAVETGICKVMAKMGISTLQSYKGAQIFEAVGLGPDVIDCGFKNTASRICGADMNLIALEVIQRHALAFKLSRPDSLILRNPGILHWRAGGERHVNEPRAVALLQEAATTNSARAYEEYVKWSRAAIRATTLRGQMKLRYPADDSCAIDLEQVESSVNDILRRFCTGAMSFGSISIEAHESLAKAMNTVGGKSNTGEGGEGTWRLYDPTTRSAIKQVASGRFGVTSAYLANADELQIKMAQGAKPGEGGELPGYKVTVDIANTRKSVPGVGLISPPPHHDIYSIEDLAQLIYDLKCANPRARISVKLVSVVGVGIVASGVAKGKAEHITISGHDGGTGASSWTGIKGAGIPWELGLSETHQVLVANDLRSRVTLQVDGQIRSAFDVIVGACLGADEFALSTAPLIVLGCTMMRKCHLNTCPVGVATQDPVLRAKFTGLPEHVINFFGLLAQEIRSEMARLGIRRFEQLIGRTDLLAFDPCNEKAAKLDFDAILCDASKLMCGANSDSASNSFLDKLPQDFKLETRKDNQLIKLLQDEGLIGALIPWTTPLPPFAAREAERESILAANSSCPKHVAVDILICNVDRTFGTTLSYEVSAFWGEGGIPPAVGSLTINARGSAGQSLGAWLAPGIKIVLEGDSNDYVGKGLSGGTIVLFPPKVLTDQLIEGHQFRSENNVIGGNVALYGATSGLGLFRGILGERFSVRNSGAHSVCEGIGDHGCEYMTGGLAVILGPTGRNFGAGMSGGVAFIYCVDHQDPETVEHVESEVEKAKNDDSSPSLIDLARKFKLMFANRCNLSSIDVFDPFQDNDDSSSSSPNLCEHAQETRDHLRVVSDPTNQLLEDPESVKDEVALKSILETFVRETGSKVAASILEDWRARRHFFVKVFPKEYQKVLAEKVAVASESAKRKATTSGDSSPTNSNPELAPKPSVKDIEDAIKENVAPKANLDKIRGFIKYKRIKGYYRAPNERTADWREVYDVPKIRSEVRVQASRCMDCGIPFCQSDGHGCPLGNLIPAFNNLVHQNKWNEAALQLMQTNNFPEFTGRVCPAPCEGSCVLGINSDPVAIKSVELSISESGFESGIIPETVLAATASAVPSGFHVAVIGSGPAGLAAAAQLVLAGHKVTVFERQPLPGGLLQFGIPSMKLQKSVIERRIRLMEQQGIKFECGVDIGRSDDWPVAKLKEHFDALALCVGATWPRDLPIPGRSGTEGIHFAMEYLGSDRLNPSSNGCDWRDSNRKISAKGKRVIVIGGGDTGCDCIGTALREGAKSVISFEILDQPPDERQKEENPWPNWPKIFRTDYGHEEVKIKKLAGGLERDPRIYNICSKEFLTREESSRTFVTGIKTTSVRWIKNGAGWKMEQIPDSEQTFECDLVLLALGFLGPESYLAQELGLDLDPRTNVIKTDQSADAVKISAPNTSVGGISYLVKEGIFAGGDCRRGQSLVVHAINEGRQTARAVDLFLKSKSKLVTGGATAITSSSVLSTSGGLISPPGVLTA